MALTRFFTQVRGGPTFPLGTSGIYGVNAPQFMAGNDYEAGDAANQADVAYFALNGLSVTSGTPLVLNFADGSLKDANGSDVEMATLVGFDIAVRTLSGTSVLTWGEGGTDIADISGKTGPRGVEHKESPTLGYAITASTADTITFTSSSGTILFDFQAWGRS